MQTAANTIQDHILEPITGLPLTPDYKTRPGGETMRALVWHGAEDVRMENCPIPDITQDDDVIIKVTGTTICGSDLHLYHSEIMALKKGDILGHEFMGKIDRVGPKVTKLKVGDRVVVSFQVACGTCKYCKQKLSSFCDKTNSSSLMKTMYGQRDAGFFGYSHFCGGLAGGQAEYVRVPFAETNCLPVPDNISDEQALYLSDVLPTSYWTIVDSGVTKGSTVAIWGLGPIGQCAIRWAKIKGAARVIGIDCIPYRLKFARERSGAETIDFKEFTDVPGKLLEMTQDNGVDFAIDCTTFHEPKTIPHKIMKTAMLETDVCETPAECIKSVRKQGTVGIIAAYGGFTNGFPIGALMEKGIRFIGNGQAPVHKVWHEILEMIQKGEFDPTFMISHRVPIDDFPALYKAFDRRMVNGLEKVFVETKFSSPPSANCPKTTRVADWKEEVPPSLIDKVTGMASGLVNQASATISQMTGTGKS